MSTDQSVSRNKLCRKYMAYVCRSPQCPVQFIKFSSSEITLRIFFSSWYDWIIQIALCMVNVDFRWSCDDCRAQLPVLACNVVASKVEREVDYRGVLAFSKYIPILKWIWFVWILEHRSQGFWPLPFSKGKTLGKSLSIRQLLSPNVYRIFKLPIFFFIMPFSKLKSSVDGR